MSTGSNYGVRGVPQQQPVRADPNQNFSAGAPWWLAGVTPNENNAYTGSALSDALNQNPNQTTSSVSNFYGQDGGLLQTTRQGSSGHSIFDLMLGQYLQSRGAQYGETPLVSANEDGSYNYDGLMQALFPHLFNNNQPQVF
jgi:hypothetical protein